MIRHFYHIEGALIRILLGTVGRHSERNGQNLQAARVYHPLRGGSENSSSIRRFLNLLPVACRTYQTSKDILRNWLPGGIGHLVLKAPGAVEAFVNSMLTPAGMLLSICMGREVQVFVRFAL